LGRCTIENTQFENWQQRTGTGKRALLSRRGVNIPGQISGGRLREVSQKSGFGMKMRQNRGSVHDFESAWWIIVNLFLWRESAGQINENKWRSESKPTDKRQLSEASCPILSWYSCKILTMKLHHRGISMNCEYMSGYLRFLPCLFTKFVERVFDKRSNERHCFLNPRPSLLVNLHVLSRFFPIIFEISFHFADWFLNNWVQNRLMTIGHIKTLRRACFSVCLGGLELGGAM
jgi:hypothetical protein